MSVRKGALGPQSPSRRTALKEVEFLRRSDMLYARTKKFPAISSGTRYEGAAKDLYDLLIARGVKVWFSEEDIRLGVPFLREIDRGLAKSRLGIVLVSPNFLQRIRGESIADKELSALLQQGQLVPIMHGTTFDALREVSPMLASHNGLSTAEDSIADVATKLADLVAL